MIRQLKGASSWLCQKGIKENRFRGFQKLSTACRKIPGSTRRRALQFWSRTHASHSIAENQNNRNDLPGCPPYRLRIGGLVGLFQLDPLGGGRRIVLLRRLTPLVFSTNSDGSSLSRISDFLFRPSSEYCTLHSQEGMLSAVFSSRKVGQQKRKSSKVVCGCGRRGSRRLCGVDGR